MNFIQNSNLWAKCVPHLVHISFLHAINTAMVLSISLICKCRLWCPSEDSMYCCYYESEEMMIFVAMKRLQEMGSSYFILDLRDNLGGLVQVCIWRRQIYHFSLSTLVLYYPRVTRLGFLGSIEFFFHCKSFLWWVFQIEKFACWHGWYICEKMFLCLSTLCLIDARGTFGNCFLKS